MPISFTPAKAGIQFFPALSSAKYLFLASHLSKEKREN
jgi:hypothetical protein